MLLCDWHNVLERCPSFWQRRMFSWKTSVEMHWRSVKTSICYDFLDGVSIFLVMVEDLRNARLAGEVQWKRGHSRFAFLVFPNDELEWLQLQFFSVPIQSIAKLLLHQGNYRRIHDIGVPLQMRSNVTDAFFLYPSPTGAEGACPKFCGRGF